MAEHDRFRVYVIDDDEVLLASLARVLLRAGYDVETYASPRAFLARPRPRVTSCVLLDLDMPELSGLELQAALAREDGATSVVFMTAHASVPSAVRALKAGAVDFLEKPFERPKLLAAVEVALRRSDARASAGAARARARERLSRLTPREREVCDRIAAGGRSRQIASALGIAETTVGLHRARVMKKTGASSVAELVRLVREADGGGAE
jgi:FixJ family two-component response regulator